MPHKKKKRRNKQKQPAAPVPVWKYKTAREFDDEINHSNSSLALVYRFYEQVPDNVFLGAILVFDVGGPEMVKDVGGEKLMDMLHYLFVRFLSTSGALQIFFMFNIPIFQNLHKDFIWAIEYRTSLIKEAKGKPDVYCTQKLALHSRMLNVIYRYVGEDADEFFVACWRYLLIGHFYFGSKHGFGGVISEEKNNQKARYLAKEIRRLASDPPFVSSHNKIDMFLALSSMKVMMMLLHVIQYQLMGKLDSGEYKAFKMILKRWPEGVTVVEKLEPLLNERSPGFFDRSHGPCPCCNKLLIRVRRNQEAESKAGAQVAGDDEEVCAVKIVKK